MGQITRLLPFLPFFTLFGLLTVGLFLFQAAAGPGLGDTLFGQTLVSVLRVIIIPLYLMRYLVVMAGIVLFGIGDGSFPVWYEIISFPVLLGPYILADLILAGWRRQSARYRRLRFRG